MLLEALEDQRPVGAAKAEIILQGDIDLHLPCRIGTVVQITLRILVENINGRRGNLMMQRQNGEHRLQTTRTA